MDTSGKDDSVSKDIYIKVDKLMEELVIPEEWSEKGKEAYKCWHREILYEIVKYEKFGTYNKQSQTAQQ